MSVLSSWLGGNAKKKKRKVLDDAIRNLKSVSPSQVRSDMGPFQAKITGMQNKGNQLFAQGQEMMDPRGEYQQGLTQQLTEQTGDTAAQAANTQSQMMAQRGMGGGGISSLLSAVNQNQAQESLRTGMSGIRQQGFSMGMQQQTASQGFLSSAMSGQSKIDENAAQARIAQTNLENQKNMQLAKSEAEGIRKDSLWNLTGIGEIQRQAGGV